MDSHAGRIHPRHLQQAVHSHHLVLHLRLSAFPVYGFLVSGSVPERSPVVLHIYYVTALSHKHFPHTDVPEPRTVDHLRMRTSIDIDQQRIAFLGIESKRIDKSVMILVFPVGGWDSA